MNVNMVSMAKQNEGIEGAKNSSDAGEASDVPTYPWGLRINLDGSTWPKIAENSTPPQIGSKMHMMINVEVVGLRQEDSQGDKKEIYLDLQITDMGLCCEKKQESSPAMKIYGKKG